MKGQAQIASSGVEALIQKLRDEGVAAGQEKAESIVLNAQKRAEWIVREAEQEAQQIVEKARAEIAAMQKAAEDALKLATRDALLKLRDTLLNSFSKEVARVVGEQMDETAFLRRLILGLAAQVREDASLDQEAEVVFRLPVDVVGVEELKKNPEELRDGALSQFAASLAGSLLRQGVRFEIADDPRNGLEIRLRDGQVSIDFSDDTVAKLLLEHLQPRFRALLQGIVK